MTNFIVNPENGKTVSIFSREGKRVLSNYLWTLKQMGGSLRKSRKKHRKCRSCRRGYKRRRRRRYRRRRKYGGFLRPTKRRRTGPSGGSGGGGSGAGADAGAGAGADAGAVAGEQDSQPTFEELYRFQKILLDVDKLDEDDAIILNEYKDIPLKPLIINKYISGWYVSIVPVEKDELVTETKLEELMTKATRLVRRSRKKQEAKINSLRRKKQEDKINSLRRLKEAYILYKSHKEAKPGSSGYGDALKHFEFLVTRRGGGGGAGGL